MKTPLVEQLEQYHKALSNCTICNPENSALLENLIYLIEGLTNINNPAKVLILEELCSVYPNKERILAAAKDLGPFKVYIIESESGWGSKVDEIKEFPTREEARNFAADYNNTYNTSTTVPDWYMYANFEE